MIKKRKIFSVIGIGTLLAAGILTVFYLKGLPYIVSNPNTTGFIQKTVKDSTNADLFIQNPVLKTSLSPEISFGADKIFLSLFDRKLLELTDFDISISLGKIFSKTVILKQLTANEIYADINGIMALSSDSGNKEKEKSKSDWDFNIEDSLLGIDRCEIYYMVPPETKLKLSGENIRVNNAIKDKRNVYFKLLAEISKNDKTTLVELYDSGNVYFQDKMFHIVDTPLKINNSSIFINLLADKKQNFDINLFSDNLNLHDVIDFLNTQIFENNVQESLVYFNDLKGNLDFKLNIKNNALKGNFKINDISFNVRDFENMPVKITQGNIDLTSDEVKLSNFEGFYDGNKENKLDFEGSIKDYMKSVDTDITGNAVIRNDMFKKYLSKMTGTPLELKGEAKTRINIKSKDNIQDFVWYFMLKPSQNIKVANDFLPFEENYRMMKSEMHLENMVLDINSIDYHMISQEEMKNLRAKIESEKQAGIKVERKKPVPIFSLSSSIDLAKNNYVKFIGFKIPEPLPSELLNAVLHQQLFKKGKISGDLLIDNKGKVPVLNGSMFMDKVLIPSQMAFVKEAKLETKGGIIHLNALGGYRRSKFKFNGDVVNELKFPVIIKDVNLSLENIDVFKLFEVFNNQNNADDVITTDSGVISVEDSGEEFDIRNLIIEKCRFHLDSGTYKEITFSNLDADLTLNKDGVIDIKSNRFDFASGMSSLKTNFDLINKQYNVKLGIVNVNSDVIADALLDLKKEITGKASGFLDLTFDDSMKLTGTMKFKISDGEIAKMGLVEYVLNCASLFRNALSMINPATFADIVNVPEGKFDKITGEVTLRNNVATRIKIKTYSSQLSNYITGRYNIENNDTSLRVYTKFSSVKKGFSGFLRKISLNSLSNRLPMSAKNDVNYYAVELSELPEIEADEKDCQIFLTKFEGDVVNNNYISSLKKIK